MAATDVSRYRWARAMGLRAFGGSVVLLAVLWFVCALAGFALWAVILLVLGAALALGCLVLLVLRPPVLLEVSTDGYRVRNVRGAGVSQARWSQVQSVEGGSGPSGSVMTISLSDGTTSTIPLSLLGASAQLAERDVHDRLNSAFGYRRLSGQ